jgi:hypothetical protein
MSYKYTSCNVPNEVYQALRDYIEEHDLECADNFRFVPVDDFAAQDEYDDIRDGGCCGYFDNHFTDSTGRLWRIGCNYGH